MKFLIIKENRVIRIENVSSFSDLSLGEGERAQFTKSNFEIGDYLFFSNDPIPGAIGVRESSQIRKSALRVGVGAAIAAGAMAIGYFIK